MIGLQRDQLTLSQHDKKFTYELRPGDLVRSPQLYTKHILNKVDGDINPPLNALLVISICSCDNDVENDSRYHYYIYFLRSNDNTIFNDRFDSDRKWSMVL